jgi:diaminohydroxyphosphoribosylaminopyrimidine deaminase / 5-amino-6-(5-phosphoribosylamino)uracil reductase
MSAEKETRFLSEAVMLGTLCPPTAQPGFSVGCVIADAGGNLIGSGYSREWGEGWHAEEIAIEKARRDGKPLKGATLYSSLEPCHPRLSGKKSCTQHIIESGIARVVFCAKEPPVYVECTGEQTLKKAGVAVIHDESLINQVVKCNRELFSKSA